MLRKIVRGGALVETHAAPANDLKVNQKELETRLQELESSLAKVARDLRAAAYPLRLAEFAHDKERIRANQAIVDGLRERRDLLAGEIDTVTKGLRSIAAQLPKAKRAAALAAAAAGDPGIREAAAELHEAAARFFSLNDRYRALRAGFALPLKAWPVPYKVNTSARRDWMRSIKNYLKKDGAK
jgi:chromosome segregation ATPase